MARPIEDSAKLYEEVKSFFFSEKRSQFVIEMSERPLNEWRTYPVNSADETIEVRGHLLEKGSELAAFMNFEGHYYFNYVDANFIKTQNLDTREVVEFFDCTVSQKFIDEVTEELRKIQSL